jgi:hypothetical protein
MFNGRNITRNLVYFKTIAFIMRLWDGCREKLVAPLPNSETRHFTIVKCDLCETKVHNV